MIIVVLIIFTFVGVVAPRFSDFVPALRVKRAADELLATTRKAHGDAALHGLHYRLNIDRNNSEYWLTVRDDPFNSPDEWIPVPGVWGNHSKLPEGVQVDGDEEYYEFFPDGTATDGSLTLRNDKDDEVTIIIVGATGRTYIEAEEEQ